MAEDKDLKKLDKDTEESVLNGGISSENADRDKIAHDEDLRYNKEDETFNNSNSRHYEDGKEYINEDELEDGSTDRDRANENLEEDILNRR